MRSKKLLAGIILILGLSLVVFFSLRKGRRVDQPDISSDKGEQRKILYYRSPMQPDFISERPGKDPMGMDLIPVYEGEKSQDGHIRIDPATVQNIGVRTEVVTRRDLKREIRTVGRITYDERKIAYVNTKIGGWIEKLYVDYEGQDVEKGQPLLEIYSPELVATQEEYLLALEYDQKMKQSSIKEVSNRAASLLEASRKRLEYWDIPAVHIDELEKTGHVNKSLMIHSPVAGVVITKTVLEGKYTKPGENLYRIADLSKVWVYADIYEYELPWVKVGQKAEISLSYLPEKVFKGKITYIYPYLETKTRTVKVRIEFDNSDGELKPDMYADVKINTSPKKSVLAVPKEAVIQSGERKIIIVDKGKGFFEPRDILVGFETKDYYEVAQGIKEGDSVVISSQFLIDSESRLNEAINKMLKAKEAKTVEEMRNIAEQEQHREMKVEAGIEEHTREAMGDIWEAYFYIREQLSKDSLAGIEEKTDLIQERASSIFNSDEAKELKNLARDILESANKFYTKDITQIREGFLDLSNIMIRYMKDFDKEGSKAKDYRLFYCGMNKKSWVQKRDEIGNPYESAAMSNCGALEDY